MELCQYFAHVAHVNIVYRIPKTMKLEKPTVAQMTPYDTDRESTKRSDKTTKNGPKCRDRLRRCQLSSPVSVINF